MPAGTPGWWRSPTWSRPSRPIRPWTWRAGWRRRGAGEEAVARGGRPGDGGRDMVHALHRHARLQDGDARNLRRPDHPALRRRGRGRLGARARGGGARALWLAPAAGGGPDHGRRHSGDALHRDGRDADGGDGPLRPRHRRALGRHRGRSLGRGALPGLPDQPPGRARGAGAEGRGRARDGRGHRRDALRRHVGRGLRADPRGRALLRPGQLRPRRRRRARHPYSARPRPSRPSRPSSGRARMPCARARSAPAPSPTRRSRGS